MEEVDVRDALHPVDHDPRSVFLATAAEAVKLLSAPELGPVWRSPSELGEFSVGGLAGHLALSVLQVEWNLDRVPSGGSAMTAQEYYAGVLPALTRSESDLNVSIRREGERAAVDGPKALHEQAEAVLARLRERLQVEPNSRHIEASRQRILLLDEYLRTRIVELTVHTEDLAQSLGLDPPVLRDEAGRITVEVLVGAAMIRNGVFPVLRSLARPRTALPRSLRVL